MHIDMRFLSIKSYYQEDGLVEPGCPRSVFARYMEWKAARPAFETNASIVYGTAELRACWTSSSVFGADNRFVRGSAPALALAMESMAARSAFETNASMAVLSFEPAEPLRRFSALQIASYALAMESIAARSAFEPTPLVRRHRYAQVKWRRKVAVGYKYPFNTRVARALPLYTHQLAASLLSTDDWHKFKVRQNCVGGYVAKMLDKGINRMSLPSLYLRWGSYSRQQLRKATNRYRHSSSAQAVLVCEREFCLFSVEFSLGQSERNCA